MNKNMTLTYRRIPKDLLYFRALNKRTTLSFENKKKLVALEKGYEGELLYDSIYDEIVHNFYIFRDIYMKIDNSFLQCDALIVHNDGVIVNEIKNFKGNYTYDNEKWYVRQKEISEDPITQLKRSTTKLIKLNYLYNMDIQTEGKVIFPNPDFVIETSHPAIQNYTIRHQLRKYLLGLNQLKTSQNADQTIIHIKKHIIENPFFNYNTNFSYLKKGVYCRTCNNFNMVKSNVHFHCGECGQVATIHTLVVQSLSDYNILFNKSDITRKNLWLFLGKQVSESTLNRYLTKYCNKLNNGPSTSYKFKYYDFNEALQNENRAWRFKDKPNQNNLI